jgi:methionyl-tRNA formyltransferase
LAALLLERDGHQVLFAALSPVAHVGQRRLKRMIGQSHVYQARGAADDLGALVDKLFDEQPIDLLVSWFWTRKLPERWLGRPRLGAIGAHPSLLPHYRGPDPFFWAIDSGDQRTGVTIHRLAAEYDTGAILASRAFEIGDRNAWELARASDRISLTLLRETVRRLADGEEIDERPQDERNASMAPAPSGDRLRVRWDWATARILRRIRALSPVPGLAIEVRGLKFFVIRARPIAPFIAGLNAGEAAICEAEQLVCIATGDGAIAIESAVLGEDAELESGRTLAREELYVEVARRLVSA